MNFKQLAFVIILCSSFAITACSNDRSTEDVFPPTKSGHIQVGNQEYKMKAGGYSWRKKEGSGTKYVQTDAASPSQIAEDLTSISIKEGSHITIKVEDNPTLSAYLWNDRGRLKNVSLSGSQFSAPSAKGRYIYEVIAEWSNGGVNGEGSYTFVVEVK